MVILLNSFPSKHVYASVSCQLKTAPCGPVSHCECFTCLTCHWILIPPSVATEIYVDSAADTGLKPHQECQLAALPCK